MALIPIRPSAWGQPEPALASLIVPVSGDLAPTEMRAEVGAGVPVTKPGEKDELVVGAQGMARWAIPRRGRWWT